MKLSTHPESTTYCLVAIKLFTLYSARYKKRAFKSLAQEDATFHSTFISHTQIGEKLENILNKLLKKCRVHVLHQIDVPTSDHWRILQHTFRCFRTKTRHAAGRMQSFRKGHVMWQMLSLKHSRSIDRKYNWHCECWCYIIHIKWCFPCIISTNQWLLLHALAICL